MLQLSESQVLEKIQHLVPFEAQLDDGSLTIRISEYQPYIATAIHHGHNLREELLAKCALSEEERYFEEIRLLGTLLLPYRSFFKAKIRVTSMT
ncbi:hypothetical protein Q8W15_05085 [Photobacterium damselae subsp. piscicida]|nr:hypothetical protein [Photobacterium damselae subsp. piscicida]